MSRRNGLAIAVGVVFMTSVSYGQNVVEGEYLVKMKKASASRVQGKMAGKAFVKAAFPTSGLYAIETQDTAFVSSLKSDPEVEYIEPNFLMQSIEPDVHQQNMSAQDARYYDQTGSVVRATEAWAVSSVYSSTNRPIVAIIDTGLDRNHFVFRTSNALWANSAEVPGDGIDNDMNGYVDDINGWNFITNGNNFNDDESHGTHVAGIVLGATQDVLATTMEPAKIRLMPLKFLDRNGSGSTYAAINAIYYAVNNGADVINCSWGGGNYSRALHDALTYAYNRGVLVVSASGNYTSNNDVTAMYPANYDVPSNLSVAATSDSDRLASFSNYGVSTVHIGSPGVYVFSTMPGGSFASLSGTSMAAPFVAGAAALALREAGQMSGYQLRSLILSSGDPVSYLNGKISTGRRINTLSLINTAKNMLSSQSFQPDYTPLYQAERSLASDDDGAGAGCGMIQSVGGAGPGAGGMLALLMGLPALLWFALRGRNPANQRRFDRYVMQSQVTIKSGDRELVGTLKTISVGGASFNVDEALDRGGTVTMKITGPDGKEAVEVEGHVVWSEQNKAYGVKFDEVRESARSAVTNWTRKLVRQD